MSNRGSASSPVWKQQWPVDGLESVQRCPICGSETRSVLHDDLWDKIFFVAPGKWTMWRCNDCCSAYLDPRPNQATIGLAYGHYYTHDRNSAMGSREPATLLARARHALGNGYRNERFGSTLMPAISTGSIFGTLLPQLRRPIELEYRYLPRLTPGRASRVLDVGCGNGTWLSTASSLGWIATGVEPDPQARYQARARGFDVRQSLSDWGSAVDHFEAITLNHVIEHVPDPLETLRQCFELLRPGGRLFIETPNIDALSHYKYGSDWRGLEPPRHLVLFTRRSLAEALRAVGFKSGRFHRRPSPLKFLHAQSNRIHHGSDPYAVDTTVPATPLPWILRIRSLLTTRCVEFLTVTADRPV